MSTQGTAAAPESRLLMIFALCAFLVGLDALVVGPLVPAIAVDLGMELELGGLLVTAYGLLYGLSAPLFGPVSDRWGRKNMMLLGMFVFAVGTALTAAATDLTTSLIYRGISGLGGAMLMPSVFALIGDTFSFEKRGKAMGLVMGAMIGSQIVGVPAGTFLAGLGSWRLSFLLIAGLGFLAMLVILAGIPKAPPTRAIPVGPVKAYQLQFKTAFSTPSVFYALLGTFLWTAGLQGMFAYVGVFYTVNFNLAIEKIGLVAMCAAAASMLGSTIGGRMSDKFGKKRVIGFAAVLSAVGVLTFALMTGNFWGAFVAQIVWAAFVGVGQATLTALSSELSPQVRGTVLALNSSALYIGLMTATAVSAAMLNNSMSFLAIGIMCALCSLAVMPLALFKIKVAEPEQAQQPVAAAK
ncbi:MFS transporter [Tumebacillus sp. DT12]|uniref:MFS transporter n=1 Tax=Tumebacillus lacus TaxID=2995335 RepID=A0ABT3X0X2_9BACL|nr:MFS transporter [Tumebacillus lacus]MCX7570556.1 MFS transporter [Tumebacillus lacus]